MQIQNRCAGKAGYLANITSRIYASLCDEGVDEDDIIGTLEHRDRITRTHLQEFNHSELKKSIALMQEPFPVLKSLELVAGDTMTFVCYCQ